MGLPAMAALFKGLLILGLVALNAFFVGAEYALLSVRRTRLEQLSKEGDVRARLALTLLSDVGTLFSALQLGMTVASLLMGALGEAIMAAAIENSLEGYLHKYVSAIIAHSISIAIAFILITTLLAVLGELVPKALAYEHAEPASLLVARPMHLFMLMSKPAVKALDGLASMVLGALGTSQGGGHGLVHTPEEAKLIVSGIRKRGLLDEDQEEMIHSVFDLHRVLVREIMVPRRKITCLPLMQDLRRLLQRIVEDRYSRVPIYEGTPDHIVGVLNTKDLFRVFHDRLRQGVPLEAPIELRAILYQPMIVPETMSLNQMLDEARARHSQIALVVDEFGTFVGLVTLEDVLEQIVGEIQDEYDREEKAIHKVGEDVLVVDASMSLRDLADDYEVLLPRDTGYETLAGFVLSRLGVIPKGGEAFEHDGRRYTVAEMEGRRVAKVKIEKLAAVSPSPTLAASSPKTPQN